MDTVISLLAALAYISVNIIAGTVASGSIDEKIVGPKLWQIPEYQVAVNWSYAAAFVLVPGLMLYYGRVHWSVPVLGFVLWIASAAYFHWKYPSNKWKIPSPFWYWATTIAVAVVTQIAAIQASNMLWKWAAGARF